MPKFFQAICLHSLFVVVGFLAGSCLFPIQAEAVSQNQKPLLIAIDESYSPYTVISPTGKPTGLFVEMWQLWSEQTGVPVTFVVSDWPGTLEALRTGKADIHSGLLANEQRAQWMDFSRPVHEIVSSVFCRSEETICPLLKDMVGKKVGAIEGSYQLQYLKDNYKAVSAVGSSNGKELVLALLNGEVDAVLNENTIVEADLASFGIRGALKRDEKQAFSNAVVAAVRKDRSDLLTIINQGFAKLSRTKLASLEERWLSNSDDRYYERLLLAGKFTPEEEKWIRDHQTVTVAVTNYLIPLDVVSADGSYSGFNAELLGLISDRTGLEFALSYESEWKTVVESVLSGKVDAGLSMSRTPEREKHALFSSPYANLPQLVVVKGNRKDVTDWEHLKGKRVAVIKNAAIIGSVKEVTGDAGELIEVTDRAELLRLVDEGKADALVVGWFGYRKAKSNAQNMDLKVVAHFVGEGGNLRIATPKSKGVLASILEKGLKRISNQELVNLRTRWLSLEEEGRVDLTAEERNWIAKHPKIKVAATDWAPFEFENDAGERIGITYDMLRLATSRVGLEFDLFEDTWENLLARVKSGDLDLAPGLIQTTERDEYLFFTKPFAVSSDAFYIRIDAPDIEGLADLKGKTIAVEQAYYTEEMLRAEHPEINLLVVKSTLDALRAVTLGDADAYLGTQAVASHLINKHLIGNLRVASYFTEAPLRVSMGVPKDREILRNILQKGLDTITPKERREIFSAYISVEDETEIVRVTLSPEEDAWVKENPTISIANTISWPPFEFLDEDGEYRGITADVLRLVTERTGLGFELAMKPWSESLQMLKDGKLDVGPGIGKTLEREKYLLYTEPYVNSSYAIYAKEGRADISTEKDFSGKTIAVEEGYMFHEYLEKNHPDANLFLANDTLGALKAVIKGEADAYIGTMPVASYIIQQNLLSGIELVGYFEDKPFSLYMATNKEHSVLRDILDKGLDSISDDEMNEIMERYVGEDAQRHLSLSDAEKQWLADHKDIRLGIEQAWLPFEGLSQDGKLEGIVSEYVAWMNKRLSISMAPVVGLSWLEILQAAKDKKVDVLPDVARTPEREEYLNFTAPYLRIPLMLITRDDYGFVAGLDDMADKRVAVIAGYMSEEYLKRDHPEIEIVSFTLMEECLEAVAEGDADAVLDNLSALTYAIQLHGYTNLKPAATTPYFYELSYGVRKDWPELVPILEKALGAISENEHRSFKDRWVNMHVESRVDWYMVWKVSFAIVLVGGIILGIIWRSNRKLAVEVNERKKAEAKIRESERVFRAILDNMPAIVFLKSMEGRYIRVNRAYENQYGVKREDVVGKTLYDLYPQDLADKLTAVDQAAIEAGKPLEGENCMVEDGKEIVLSNVMFPVVDDDGKMTAFGGIETDITRRRIAERKLEDAYDVISGSINYATNIQGAILPSPESLEETFSEHFALWEPRDKVGGDIYFMKPWGRGKMIALGDCTGHGVPGAFMTLIVNGALEMALMEVAPGDAASLLQRTHQLIQRTLDQDVEGGSSDDGIEMGVCYLDPRKEEICYAGARFSLFSTKDGEVAELKGDKKGLGYRATPQDATFTNHCVQLDSSTTYYMTTDGLIDQVGGQKHRGFGKKRFKKLLTELDSLPMNKRGQALLDALVEYQGDEKRRDDLAVIGFRT